LTYLNIAKSAKDKILAEYPGLAGYFQALEELIVSSPETGRDSRLPTQGGKTLPCKEKSVSLDFFDPRYAIGYSRLTAAYVFNKENAAVIHLYFT
jgi:hypothetical protein